MRKFIAILISMILFFIGGCKIKNTFQYTTTKESVVLIPNTLLDIPEITETIVKTVVELTTVIFSTVTDAATTVPIIPTTEKSDSEIVQLVNDIRLKNELTPLELSSDLCLVAEIRAKEVSKLWSHTRPDGTNVDSLAEKYGITDWSLLGENLAKYTPGCGFDDVVDAWVNSQTHYKNLINPRFRKFGIGEYEDESYIYVSLIFSD